MNQLSSIAPAPEKARVAEPVEAMQPPLLTAMRALQAALEACDRQVADRLGMCLNDARALRFLAEQGPVPARHVMAELALTSGSVTALLDRLEGRGLTLRTPDTHDRRVVLVSVSEQGAGLIGEAYGPLHMVTEKLSGRLGEGKAQDVIRQINDLVRLTQWACNSMV